MTPSENGFRAGLDEVNNCWAEPVLSFVELRPPSEFAHIKLSTLNTLLHLLLLYPHHLAALSPSSSDIPFLKPFCIVMAQYGGAQQCSSVHSGFTVNQFHIGSNEMVVARDSGHSRNSRNISRRFELLSRSVHLMLLAQFSLAEVPLLLSRLPTYHKICVKGISMRWMEIEGSFGKQCNRVDFKSPNSLVGGVTYALLTKEEFWNPYPPAIKEIWHTV
ncbi:hypothetical protein BDZ97DRAFT_2061951 [Flammula alnicola]|nr:hypothetical protein BDZ97DRAFT_2061951 [Flammula alnicola]